MKVKNHQYSRATNTLMSAEDATLVIAKSIPKALDQLRSTGHPFDTKYDTTNSIRNIGMRNLMTLSTLLDLPKTPISSAHRRWNARCTSSQSNQWTSLLHFEFPHKVFSAKFIIHALTDEIPPWFYSPLAITEAHTSADISLVNENTCCT